MRDEEGVRAGLSGRRATARMRLANMVGRVGRGSPHAYGTHGSSDTHIDATCGLAKVGRRRPSSHCEASIPRAPATAPM